MRTAAVCPMRGDAARLVHELKYAGWTALASKMGPALAVPARSLASQAGVRASDLLLVPVPITPARRRERGFNQARLLGDALADVMKARVAELLERRRSPRAQVHLRRGERLANARGSFRALARPSGALRGGRSVLLVDDVVTTGATAAACAATLGEAGWLSIGLVSFARSWRTLEPSGDSSPPM